MFTLLFCTPVSPHCAKHSVKLEPFLLHPDTAASTQLAAAGHSAGDADMQSQQQSDTADVSGSVD
eukprot:6071-Heterococcus_DN1.PRE.1